MDILEKKIDNWKGRLIDLTKRNKLLNFKQTRLSTAQVLLPSVYDVFDSLVEENDELKFVFEPEMVAAYFETGELRYKLRKREILSHTLSDKPKRMLNNLISKARSALEEQGVNILFFSFGLCKWFDPKEPEKELLAPLVLVPVQIKRLAVNGPYTVKRFEEDVVVNPAFLRQLKDMEIETEPVETVDEDAENDDCILKRYFEAFREITTSQNKWEIVETCYAGLFSYHKFVMYKDIENNTELITQNLFLKALATGKYVRDDSGNPEQMKHLDDIKYERQFQILDADSSQQEAIECVKSGRDVVIQGPPGTGKSQTIVNIIAESIAADKKVLFVSEKQAALNVVKKRLEENHLGPFCLELHSKKASKHEVYHQFDDVLSILGIDEGGNGTFDFETLEALRENLNAKLRMLNQLYGKLNLTPLEVFNTLICLTETEDIRFDLEEFLSITHEDLKKIEEVFKQITDGNKIFFDHIDKLQHFKFRGFEKERVEDFRLFLQSMDELLLTLREKMNPTNLKRWNELRESEKAILKQNNKQLKKLEEDFPDFDAERLSLLNALELYSKEETGQIKLYNNTISKINELFGTISQDLADLSHKTNSGIEVKRLSELDDLCLFLSEFKTDAFNLDLNQLETLWKDKYNNFFSRLFGGYGRNLKAVKAVYRNAAAFDKRHVLDFLSRAVRCRKLFKKSGIFSDSGISESVRGLRGNLRSLISEQQQFLEINKKIFLLLENKNLHLSTDEHNTTTTEYTSLTEWVHAVLEAKKQLIEKNVNCSIFYSADLFSEETLNIDALKKELDSLLFISGNLMNIERFSIVINTLKTFGLTDFLNRYFEMALSAEEMGAVFKKGLYKKYLKSMYEQNEALYFFKSSEYENKRESFKALDVEQFSHNIRRIAKKRIDLNPKYNFFRNCDSDLSRLKREIAKKRRQMPVRRLFATIPELVQMLKPCMLMSPLSVSHFLDSSRLKFDLVIFDEASQVLPEDAVGSIMRASQVVIVGDVKQLPPTQFFRATESDTELDNEADYLADNLDSILEEAATMNIEQKSLLWHYRSRNEDLIYFSNHNFYEDNLVTFPSNHPESDDYGVFFEFVEGGIYDRGRSRKNPKEAERIADIIFDFAKKNPEKSLGIVTFNEAQKNAIMDRLEELRETDDSLEAFFDDEREDPFFVKNLESVQGDERDVIMFSVGYGKDKTGRMSYNFGPLNREGGERRLNVAVTRAREKVLVVSSITFRDLPEDSKNGVKALREYLQYAQQSEDRRELYRSEQKEKTSFMKDVMHELKSLGYECDCSVGCSKYRIDIAVKNAQKKGHYYLGIECDLSDSSGTLRDRDRTREGVLKRLGWKMLRIWSKEWVEDSASMLQKIIATMASQESEELPQEEQQNTPLYTKGKAEKAELFRKYEKFTIEDFQTLFVKETLNMRGLVLEILQKEAPMSFSELMKRLNDCYEYTSDSRQMKLLFKDYVTEKGNLKPSEIKKLLKKMTHKFKYDEKFILPVNKNIDARQRDEDVNISIDNIHEDERKALITEIVKHAAYIDTDDLIFECARHLGFARAGGKIKSVLIEDIDKLHAENRLNTEDDRISLRYIK